MYRYNKTMRKSLFEYLPTVYYYMYNDFRKPNFSKTDLFFHIIEVKVSRFF